MNATRKGFLLGLGAATVAPRLLAEDEKPLFKVGITTDTHFGRRDVKGVERVEKAWNLFKKQGCAVIANCGDIADRFLPKWYEEVCLLRTRVFDDPKTAPREVWVYAGHDRIDMPGDTDNKGIGNYALLKEKLQITHEAYDRFSMAGFEFLIIPAAVDFARYEQMVADACQKTPGKPVFIFDHHPASRTTENSAIWGDGERRKLLSKYPQVVHITGHAHGSLYNEQNIHQGAFTSVSAGCLTYFSENYTGAAHRETGQNRSVLVLEVFSGHAVFRRYSIDTGAEIGADEPWTITWPYDPKKPFYSHENMRARHRPADFPPGAALAVSTVTMAGARVSERGVKLRVDIPVTGSRFTRHYRVEAYRFGADDARVPILHHDIRGEFWRDPPKRAKQVVAILDAAFFEPGEKIELTATPCDFWGGEGKPLVWRGTAPTDTFKVVWRGELTDKAYRLPAFPPEVDGKDVKIFVDAEFNQPGAQPVSIGVKPCDFWWAARVSTPLGHTKLTYGFHLAKVSTAKRYEFSFQGGERPLSVKFSNLRYLADGSESNRS